MRQRNSIRNRVVWAGILLSLTLFSASCESTILVLRNGSPTSGVVDAPARATAERPPDVQKREASLFFGIKGIGNPLEIPCKDTPREIRVRKDAYDTLIHFFLGIGYTTRSVSVYCNAPQ